MNDPDILIIGAGATGLMAARTLTKAGKKVTVLEARNRIGGRIHTLEYGASQHPAEMGAEFIHGDLPVTLGLLKEARIAYSSASASMWKYKDGEFSTGEQFMDNWDLLMERLKALKKDITIEAFLQKDFVGDEYKGLRRSVRQFVSGYDNADPEKASTFALRREWQSEDEGAQHRVDRGYNALVKYFADEVLKAGGNICLNAVVKNISWQPYKVKVTTDKGASYEAKQLLIAMPLGVLQAAAKERGAITFKPAISKYKKAINGLGFGAVIKILLEFDDPFWESKETEKLAGKSLKNMGYLFSEEEIPTWWTQVPKHTSLLTGWVGGPEATAKINLSDEEILQQGLQSIANIFKINVASLKQKLLTWNVVNWTADPLTRGSYAYDTINAAQARKLLCEPIEDTLFFAGEYLYEGTAIGTVEAALTSGLRAAKKILDK